MPERFGGPYRRFARSNFATDAIFDPKPTSLVLIAALEITVSDQFGHYLLLISPRYEQVELADGQNPATLPESNHWTVPFVSRTLETPSGGYKNVATTLVIAERETKKWVPKRELTNYARAVFRGITDIQSIESFYELKRSWSQPQVTKLYKIMRYRAELGNCEASTFADPDSRKGIAFIPIDDRYERIIRKRDCPVHQREETLYLSTPLESNVSAILNEKDQRGELCAHALPLDRGVFYREYHGLLLCGDIAGYGLASEYAEDHMSDLADNDHGAVLRDSASVAFTDLFIEAGVAQVHTAGDGFVCAIPLATGSKKPTQTQIKEALRHFIEAYITYIERLDKLNQALEKHFRSNPTGTSSEPTMGSRLVIHVGGYRYGKMSQAASLLTGFDGREIVAVTRLEQALRDYTHEKAAIKRHKLKGTKHFLAASEEVMKAAKTLPLEEIGRFTAESKEFAKTAVLLRLSR
jgi:hypothetical protein